MPVTQFASVLAIMLKDAVSFDSHPYELPAGCRLVEFSALVCPRLNSKEFSHQRNTHCSETHTPLQLYLAPTLQDLEADCGSWSGPENWFRKGF